MLSSLSTRSFLLVNFAKRPKVNGNGKKEKGIEVIARYYDEKRKEEEEEPTKKKNNTRNRIHFIP